MDQPPKFEEGLAALEKLVEDLERGDLGLDEALKRFEQGVTLAQGMQKSLEDTGRKLEQLAAGGLEPLAETPDGGEGAEGPTAPVRRRPPKERPEPPSLF